MLKKIAFLTPPNPGMLRCTFHQASFSLRSEAQRTEAYASPLFLVAALPAERHVLARRGWAGQKSGLFEHPAHYSVLITASQQAMPFSILLACQCHDQRFCFLSGPAIRFQRVFQRLDVFGGVDVHCAANDLRNIGEPDPPFKNASTAISFAAFIVAGIVPPIRRDS